LAKRGKRKGGVEVLFLAKRGKRKGGVELFCKLIFSIVIKDSIDAILH
jgi:hypothetical protein